MPIIGTERVPGREKLPVRPDSNAQRDAWTLIGWIGVAFVLMGIADIGLGFYPAGFGNAEWEFGVISGTLNGFAIPTMGAYLLLASALARQKPVLIRTASFGMFVVAAMLVLFGLLYVTVIPIALKAVDRNEVVLLGMKKGIAKAAILLVGYWLLFVLAGLRGLRAAKRV